MRPWRAVLLIVLFWAAALGPVAYASGSAEAKRPNVLLILADDLSEKKNLAAERPDKVKELRARYDAYARQAVAPKSRPKPKDFQSPKVWGETDGPR